jgi:hypothetical protein
MLVCHFSTVSVAIHRDSVSTKVEEHMMSLCRPAVTSIKREPSCTNWCIASGSITSTLDPIVTNTSRFFGIILMQVGPINWIFFHCERDGGIIGWHQFCFVSFKYQDGRRSTPLRKDPASSSLTTMVNLKLRFLFFFVNFCLIWCFWSRRFRDALWAGFCHEG